MSKIIIGNYYSNISDLSNAHILWLMLTYNTIYLAIKLGTSRERTVANTYLHQLRLYQEYKQKGLFYCCSLRPIKPPVEASVFDNIANLSNKLLMSFIPQPTGQPTDLIITTVLQSQLVDLIRTNLNLPANLLQIELANNKLLLLVDNISSDLKKTYIEQLYKNRYAIRDIIVSELSKTSDEHCPNIYVWSPNKRTFHIHTDPTFGKKKMTMDELYLTIGKNLEAASDYFPMSGKKIKEIDHNFTALLAFLKKVKHLNHCIKYVYRFLMINYKHSTLSKKYIKALAKIRSLEKLLDNKKSGFEIQTEGIISGTYHTMIIEKLHNYYFGPLPDDSINWDADILCTLNYIAKILRNHEISPYANELPDTITYDELITIMSSEFGI